MAEVLFVEVILKTGKIKSSTICRIEKKPILVWQSLRASLRVSAPSRNMQRYCGECLRNEREICGNRWIESLCHYWHRTDAHPFEWQFWLNRICVPEVDTILYEPCIPFYDGQWFWNVLRLLSEIQGTENWYGRVLRQKIQQNLVIFCIALCAGLCNVT